MLPVSSGPFPTSPPSPGKCGALQGFPGRDWGLDVPRPARGEAGGGWLHFWGVSGQTVLQGSPECPNSRSGTAGQIPRVARGRAGAGLCLSFPTEGAHGSVPTEPPGGGREGAAPAMAAVGLLWGWGVVFPPGIPRTMRCFPAGGSRVALELHPFIPPSPLTLCWEQLQAAVVKRILSMPSCRWLLIPYIYSNPL